MSDSTTPSLVVTHPGGAHKDEFLACSVLVAAFACPIQRRDPTPADLADPGICVVDVGHEHAPERHNFDHHQFPRDHAPTCSLSLVLQHLGRYQDARQFCDWLEPAEWFDCRGLEDTAEWLGVERKVMEQLNSPIDLTLLRRFAASRELKEGEPLWEMMRMIGQDLLDYLRTMRERLDFIEQHGEFWELDSEGESFRVLFLPRTDPLPEEPSMGITRFLESKGVENEITGLIYPDRRGGGYGLARFRDNKRLDFTQIASAPDVHFAHVRGFIAKCSATETARLKDLMAQSFLK